MRRRRGRPYADGAAKGARQLAHDSVLQAEDSVQAAVDFGRRQELPAGDVSKGCSDAYRVAGPLVRSTYDPPRFQLAARPQKQPVPLIARLLAEHLEDFSYALT